jgi:2-hydroxy-3-keto-5-methylthiopentenyl-1-phosphate phosphatase
MTTTGRRVVAVGDGNADRCMAGVADVLFARGRLLEWCGRKGVPCEPFETLDFVADLVEHLAGDEASWRSDDNDSREDVSCQGEGQWT